MMSRSLKLNIFRKLFFWKSQIHDSREMYDLTIQQTENVSTYRRHVERMVIVFAWIISPAERITLLKTLPELYLTLCSSETQM